MDTKCRYSNRKCVGCGECGMNEDFAEYYAIWRTEYKAKLKQHGIVYKQVASKLDISSSYVSLILNGYRCVPNETDILDYALKEILLER